MDQRFLCASKQVDANEEFSVVTPNGFLLISTRHLFNTSSSATVSVSPWQPPMNNGVILYTISLLSQSYSASALVLGDTLDAGAEARSTPGFSRPVIFPDMLR